MISVSGVFRKMLTQAAPKARSTGTGETRMAASSVPRIRAKTAEAAVSLRIQRKPVTYASTLAGSEKTSIATLKRGDRGRAGPDPHRSRAVGQLADVQLGRRLAALAERVVPRLLVRPVGAGGLQDLIDLVAAGGVLLLQPD